MFRPSFPEYSAGGLSSNHFYKRWTPPSSPPITAVNDIHCQSRFNFCCHLLKMQNYTLLKCSCIISHKLIVCKTCILFSPFFNIWVLHNWRFFLMIYSTDKSTSHLSSVLSPRPPTFNVYWISPTSFSMLFPGGLQRSHSNGLLIFCSGPGVLV